MTYVKTYLSTLKTHVVNLKRDAKGLSRDLQRLEVRGKLGSKTLYCKLLLISPQLPFISFPPPRLNAHLPSNKEKILIKYLRKIFNTRTAKINFKREV